MLVKWFCNLWKRIRKRRRDSGIRKKAMKK